MNTNQYFTLGSKEDFDSRVSEHSDERSSSAPTRIQIHAFDEGIESHFFIHNENDPSVDV